MKTLCLLFVSICFSVSLVASWTVSKLKGESLKRSGDVEVSLSKGDSLLPGDKILTGPGSKLKLSSGASSLWLGQNSIFVIPVKQDKDEKSYLMTLLKGKMRAKVKPGTVNKFEVSTPTAVAGVRGTEFFVDADDENSFVCTLKGEVEVRKIKQQKSLSVPMCAGVKLGPASQAELLPTPPHVVARWVAQTSIEDTQPVVVSEYKFRQASFKPFAEKWFYRTELFTNALVLEGTNYGSPSGELNNQIFYTRIASAVRYKGPRLALQLELRYLGGAAGNDFKFSRTGEVGKNISEFQLGESFVESEVAGGNIRLGLQSIKWNDGNLLSRDFWGLETYLYPALRYSAPVNTDFYLDFFATAAGGESKGSGQVPVEMLGLKIDFRAWANLYVLSRDYKPTGLFKAVTQFDHHKVTDLGFKSGHLLTRWDYELFYNHQTGRRFSQTTNKEHSEASLGASYGYYPYPHRDIRVGIGFNRATSNYLPGFESPFLLGYSQLMKRTNMQQFRFNLGFGINDRWTMNVEQIKNVSFNSGDFSSWSGREEGLFDEFNLGFLYNREESNLSSLIALFYLSPRSGWTTLFPSTNGDSGTGIVLNLQKSF